MSRVVAAGRSSELPGGEALQAAGKVIESGAQAVGGLIDKAKQIDVHSAIAGAGQLLAQSQQQSRVERDRTVPSNATEGERRVIGATGTTTVSVAGTDVLFEWSSWGWDVKASRQGNVYDFYDAPHGVGSNFIEQSNWPVGETRSFPSKDGDQSCPVRVAVTILSYHSKNEAEVSVSVAPK